MSDPWLQGYERGKAEIRAENREHEFRLECLRLAGLDAKGGESVTGRAAAYARFVLKGVPAPTSRPKHRRKAAPKRGARRSARRVADG